ncbi:hypothetical protein RN001_014962 [Aquatica leii]|uniref:Uncharacterized protein n=1 Tax=Aquatica leii TaxID=1421715 RepID=A0AAN7P165_9COLE|nr:hypothetical protein RN001_014962 [Aquatica leii]
MKKRLEAQEKNSKKNNIIIKGTTAQDNNLKVWLKELIKKETGARIEVETVYKIGKQKPKMVITKLKNFEQKMEVIKNKYKLGGKNIYIDSDLTYEEQKTQEIIRKIAKEEKNKGNSIKVSYKKLEINGVKYIWNEEKNKLTKNQQEIGQIQIQRQK